MRINMPADYAVDSTQFRACRVTGPLFPHGVVSEMHPDYFALNPTGFGFHVFQLQPGGVMVQGPNGAVLWRAQSLYNAIDIPWWSLMVLFSLWPGASWLARRRHLARVRRGLCLTCGYDLRESPGRCPERGTATAMPPA